MTVAELIATLAEYPPEMLVLVESVHEPMAGASYLGIQHLERAALAITHELTTGPALVIDARVDLDQLYPDDEEPA